MFPALLTAAAVTAVVGHDVEKGQPGIAGVGPGTDPAAGGRLFLQERFSIFQYDLFDAA